MPALLTTKCKITLSYTLDDNLYNFWGSTRQQQYYRWHHKWM